MYEKYRQLKSFDAYFKSWEHKKVAALSPLKQLEIYDLYKLKCEVFQRDAFKCQHEKCKTPTSRLTLHHIKWQKNNGKSTARNCVALCKACHAAFHQGKIDLYLWGRIYKLTPASRSYDWKQARARAKLIRKANKMNRYVLSWERVFVLMQFLWRQYDYPV